jgi:hypothetical protein
MRVAFVSPNKFIIKIDSMICLMILIMYYKYILIFFYINVVKVISQEARTTVILGQRITFHAEAKC